MGHAFSSLLVAILLVGVLALVGVQPSSAIDLRYHWASDVLLLGMLAVATRRWHPLLRAETLAGVALALMLVLLWWTLQEGVSTWNFIAGVLPASDAAGYFSDAQRILAGTPISDFSSRRPLFAAFLAGILGVAGNDLQLALFIVTLFVGATLMICIGLLPRTLPYAVAAAFIVTIVLYYRRFVGTTLTEQLGLACGLLAFGLLARGFHDGRRCLIVGGIFVLSLALNARAGAFVALPLLILLAARLDARPGHLLAWRTLGWLLGAAAAPFVANQLLLTLFGGQRAATFSNFSYVLYGLVFGGDWTLAHLQHPELSALPAAAEPEAVFRLALQGIVDHPSAIVLGALKAWTVFLPTAYVFAASHHPFALALLPYFVLSVLAFAGLLHGIRQRGEPLMQMLLVGVLGIFLSVPFVPPWDADQMRAHAATLPFIAWLPALGVAALWPSAAVDHVAERPADASHDSAAWTWLATIFVLLVMTLIVLPVWAKGRYPVAEPAGSRPACTAEEIPVSALILPGTLREVGAGQGRPDLKSVGKRFLLDPAGGLRDAWQLAGRGDLTKAALERNALAEYAPETVRRLVQDVRIGERFAYARVAEKADEIPRLRLVFLHRTAGHEGTNRYYCARKRGQFDALELDGRTAP